MSNKLTIDVREWGRGNPPNSVLRSLNLPNKKCCLGFYGEECEVGAAALDGIAMPKEEVEAWPRWLFRDDTWQTPTDIISLDQGDAIRLMALSSPSPFRADGWTSDILAAINDCENLTEEERRALLVYEFKRMGQVDVTFIGDDE